MLLKKITPLHWACPGGHLPIVQYLIENGADLEAKDKEQQTPLQLASKYDHTDIVKYLTSNDWVHDKSQRKIMRETQKQKDCIIG